MSDVRDMNRLVLAEDDIDVAQDLRQVLESLGGYEVWVTRFSKDVISLLTKTNSMWLVLDLNLEDCYSGDRIGMRSAKSIFPLPDPVSRAGAPGA